MVMINEKLALEAKSAPALAPHPLYQAERASQLCSSRHGGPRGGACAERPPRPWLGGACSRKSRTVSRSGLLFWAADSVTGKATEWDQEPCPAALDLRRGFTSVVTTRILHVCRLGALFSFVVFRGLVWFGCKSSANFPGQSSSDSKPDLPPGK